jgi:hypothetical protein
MSSPQTATLDAWLDQLKFEAQQRPTAAPVAKAAAPH